MKSLKRQINRQKAKIIILSIVIWILSSIGFTWLLYNKEMERVKNVSAQAIEGVLPWGVGFAAVALLWGLIVLIIVELKDNHNKGLKRLTEEERLELEQMVDIDFFKLKLTMGELLVVLNANGYTLKIIPIRDIARVYMKRNGPAKPRYSAFDVIHFCMKSGKTIRSSAVAITDPIYPIIKMNVDSLAERI